MLDDASLRETFFTQHFICSILIIFSSAFLCLLDTIIGQRSRHCVYWKGINFCHAMLPGSRRQLGHFGGSQLCQDPGWVDCDHELNWSLDRRDAKHSDALTEKMYVRINLDFLDLLNIPWNAHRQLLSKVKLTEFDFRPCHGLDFSRSF